MRYKLLLLACLIVTGCATATFKPWSNEEVYQGKGGSVQTVEGIDVWEYGEPDRPYRIIGIIQCDVPITGGHLVFASMLTMDRTVIDAAKQQEADGIVPLKNVQKYMGDTPYGRSMFSLQKVVVAIKYVTNKPTAPMSVASTDEKLDHPKRNATKGLAEQKKLAENNPESFVEKAYAGVNVIWNRENKYEVVFVSKDSPADIAGIIPGDIVLSLDEIPIRNRYQAFEIYDKKYPGEVMSVKLKRKNRILTKEVKLESHYFLYPYYVLMELINKDIPIRLAFFVQDIKSEKMNDQDMKKWKSSITSYLVGSLESIFIKNYRGQNNFAIVDRAQTEVVLQELAFQKSGLVPSNLQSKLAMLGATHLFIVNVSLLESTNTGYSMMRLIEVESGKVIATASLEQRLNGNTQENDQLLAKGQDEQSSFAGNWAGKFNDLVNQQSGLLSVTISKNNKIVGSIYNATTSVSGSVFGTISNTGIASMTYTYPGVVYTATGVVSINGAGHLVGNFNAYSGNILIGTAIIDFIKQ